MGPVRWVCLVVALIVPAAGVGAQVPEARFDTASLASGPHARACMLLERTIFQVDVLTIELRFGPETAERLRELLAAGAPRDSLARMALRSRDAYARIEFVRDVAMDRFIDGVRTDLRKVADAGVIGRDVYREVSDALPRWYGFLDGRDVREGDALVYRVRGDTLYSGYRSPTGEGLLRQRDVGPERRLSVLGSYLVEGSSFREGLLDSLVDDAGC